MDYLIGNQTPIPVGGGVIQPRQLQHDNDPRNHPSLFPQLPFPVQDQGNINRHLQLYSTCHSAKSPPKHKPAMHTKGPKPVHHNGSGLRIGIVHARWNDSIIEPLVAGAKAKLLECGVQESNIVVQSVPGAWELPIAVQRYVLPSTPLVPPLC